MGFKTAGLIRISGLENGTDVDVLEAIATFLNEETGRCFPALDSVMLIARKSRNVVRQSIKDLCAQGLLSFSAEPGKVRNYGLNVAMLPEPKIDSLKKLFELELGKRGQKMTGFRSEPGSEVNREGVQKCTPTGFRSEPPPGSEVNPEQGNNKEEKKEENREDLCASASQTQPPELSDEDLESLFANAQLEECPPFPEKGEHLSTATKHRATTRRKPSTPCPFDMESSIPDEYKAIAEKAGIGDPQQVFSAFVNHALAHDRRLVIWPAGFRTWCSNEIRYHPNQTPKPKPLHQRTADDYNW